MVTIHNIRLGHAANSSSTHTVVLYNKTPKFDPAVPGAKYKKDGSYHFGEDTYVLKTPKDKSVFILSQLFETFKFSYGIDVANLLITSLFPKYAKLIEYKESNRDYGHYHNNSNTLNKVITDVTYVDNEDIPMFITHDGNLHTKFITEFINHLITNKRVVISGGSDDRTSIDKALDSTTNKATHSTTDPVVVLLNKYSYYNNITVIQDGDYWILYNRINGSKITLSLKKSAPKYTYSSFPMLVDMKITQYCESNCSMCYMSSNTSGKHGDDMEIHRIVSYLCEGNTLELAFGGGEPTTHPQFAGILRYAFDKHITPNFTSKNYSTLLNTNFYDTVFPIIGRAAYSVNSLDELDEFESILKKVKDITIDRVLLSQYSSKSGTYSSGNDTLLSCIGIQCVLEMTPHNFIERVLRLSKEYDLPVTFLGFKEVGRGKAHAPLFPLNVATFTSIFSSDIAKDRIEEGRISFDTKALQLFGPAFNNIFEDKNIIDETMYITEGSFSWYIDAVSETCAPSSYADKKFTSPLSFKSSCNLESLKEKYQVHQTMLGLRT